MKKLTLLYTILSLLTISFLITSCSSNDKNIDEPAQPDNGKPKILYKIIGSDDVDITEVDYNDETGKTISLKGNFGTAWASDTLEMEKSDAVISTAAVGKTDDATLKIQILVNGKVIKESAVATGKILTKAMALVD